MKKNLILLFLVSSILSCKLNIKQKEENIESQKESINEIIIHTCGGEGGVSDIYIFNKDSISHHFYLAVDTTKNINKNIANNKYKWKSLVNKVDLATFKKLTNGKSYKEVDGTDIEISVKTKKGKEYKFINGEGNKEWDSIYKEFRRQIRK
ncbi:hypothetical protein [Tenacibaculum sp. nBUS_03]|uniref:hypothetical protein n=1 Tax=Tenacibaculum sp. nBUS_03 TaxID=3395320 RepID=UPI003EC01630